MSNLITSNTITMSSREIADLTGKEHKNVKRDIESMLSDLEEDALTFERIYFDSMNRQQTEYMDRGYFTVKETAVNTNHGIHISFTTKLTGKGQQWLTRKLVDNGLLKALGDAA